MEDILEYIKNIESKNIEEKNFGFGKKNFGFDTNTEIGPWFRFPIPKTSFGHTLISSHHYVLSIQVNESLNLPCR